MEESQETKKINKEKIKEYRIRVKPLKINMSYYALIPSGVVKELELNEDSEILACFIKLDNVIEKLCLEYKESQETILIKTNDNKEMVGLISEVDKKSITFISNEKNFILPFNHIQELNLQDKK